MQRQYWHAKLGNLVLLPATASSAALAGADFDAKVAMWRQAGVAQAAPGFSAPLLAEGGRYARFKFAFDECRQRHADMVARLAEVFDL